MTIGELINELIWDNIKVWHTATLIRKENRDDMSLEDIARIYLECRVYNTDRSRHRTELDLRVGEGFDDNKVNYLEK